MRTLLEFLQRIASLLVQAASALGLAMLNVARRGACADLKGRGAWSPLCATLVRPCALRTPDRTACLQAALVRYEQLLGWRHGGAPTSEAHVLAA